MRQKRNCVSVCSAIKTESTPNEKKKTSENQWLKIMHLLLVALHSYLCMNIPTHPSTDTHIPPPPPTITCRRVDTIFLSASSFLFVCCNLLSSWLRSWCKLRNYVCSDGISVSVCHIIYLFLFTFLRCFKSITNILAVCISVGLIGFQSKNKTTIYEGNCRDFDYYSKSIFRKK